MTHSARLIASVLVWSAACVKAPAVQPPSRHAVAPAALRRPSALSYDFQWRQHVSARWPTGRHNFDAVLQKRDGELILMGLSPLGLPGFVFRLSQSGTLQVDNRTGKPLPFEPAYVVADVQRVFFPWLPPPPLGYSGQRCGKRGESMVTERYEQGRLVERRFERATPEGRERVVIHYDRSSSNPDADAPAHAELYNSLLGYGLVIDTLEQTRL